MSAMTREPALLKKLTEQAETHAIELRAYEATVANLNERIRQIDERMQSYVTVGDGLVVYGTFDAVKRVQLYILLDSNHPVESTDSRKLLALELQKAEQRIRQLDDGMVPEGYVLAPIEPTPAMINAARWDEFQDEGDIRMTPVSDDVVAGVWADMLAALPQPKEGA